MTTYTPARRIVALRRAAVRATLAPSVHNTQPWLLQLSEGKLSLYADRRRQLNVLDPSGRQLIISGGCALMNARVSLARDGVAVTVDRFPDPARSDLLAVLTPSAELLEDQPELGALDSVLELRQTNRRRFADDDVPADVLGDLEHAVAAEGSSLHVVRDPERRLAVANLSQRADDIENLNPAYRAELRAWTSNSPARRDGVPHVAVPHVDGSAQDDIPMRDFDTHGDGGLPAATHSSTDQCLVLICTNTDLPTDWLRAGEALERMLLEITRHGFTASPLTQVTEVPSARTQLRQELSLVAYPQVLLRIGRAALTPTSRRRRLVDMLTEDS
jgi:hypothetical protein